MKYMKQFAIIMLITFLGEILKTILPLPVPASIYGLVLMFFALQFKIVRLEEVKETASFLIEIMPMMFIPAAAGLIVSWTSLQQFLVPIVIMTFLSTIIVMVITGRFSQYLIRRDKGKGRS